MNEFLQPHCEWLCPLLAQGEAQATIKGLDGMRRGFSAIRSYRQLNASGASQEVQNQLRDQIDAMGEIYSHARMRSALCQVSHDRIILTHSGEGLPQDFPDNSVRGFLTIVRTEQYELDIVLVILDQGGSRVYYDRKNDEEKWNFFQQAARRIDAGKTKKGFDYFVLLGDDGHMYTIEQQFTRADIA